MMGDISRCAAIQMMGHTAEGLERFYMSLGKMFDTQHLENPKSEAELKAIGTLEEALHRIMDFQEALYYWTMGLKDRDELISLIAEYDLPMAMSSDTPEQVRARRFA